MQSIEFESIRNLAALMNKGIKVDNGVATELKQKFFDLLNASAFDKLMILLQILQDLAHNSAFRFLCEQEFTGDLNDRQNTHQYRLQLYPGALPGAGFPG